MPTKLNNEIELVVFKSENTNVMIAGVTLSRWEKDWKHSTAEMIPGGILFSVPNHRSVLIPMHCIRQIEFKV